MSKEAPNFVVRGILIGASVGVLGYLVGFLPNLPRAIALGMVPGFVAGITLARAHKAKHNDDDE
ncbi:hypothetical protein [Halodesulfovibrio sp. MK-HDV]|jgi:hypothetical protein|uniref:hypothetical protein n=1 Tax=Halodesulfovibrio sp. MK-HDV TaxID=2599925 RepID=UPI00136B81AE|nr:hypothetical protein [Halodesulfovibrio sp. MK-HDV]KAF1076025.1 hypothetical protein MKHDV_01461 [Halodesulfovibrio sp. MK-HDV]